MRTSFSSAVANVTLALTLTAPAFSQQSKGVELPLNSSTGTVDDSVTPKHSKERINAQMQAALLSFGANFATKEILLFGEHAVPPLIEMASDLTSPEEVRCEACICLGIIGGDKATTYLTDLANKLQNEVKATDVKLVEAIASGLVHSGHPDAAKSITGLYRALIKQLPPEDLNFSFIKFSHVLNECVNNGGLTQRLKLAGDESLPLQFRISLLVPSFERNNASEALLLRERAISLATKTGDPSEKATFLYSAAAMGASKIIPDLLSLAADRRLSEEVRAIAVAALGRLQAIDAIRSLLPELPFMPHSAQLELISASYLHSRLSDLHYVCMYVRDKPTLPLVPLQKFDKKFAVGTKVEPGQEQLRVELGMFAAEQAMRYLNSPGASQNPSDVILAHQTLDAAVPIALLELVQSFEVEGEKAASRLPESYRALLIAYTSELAKAPNDFDQGLAKEVFNHLIRVYPEPLLLLLNNADSALLVRSRVAEVVLKSGRPEHQKVLYDLLTSDKTDPHFVNAVRFFLPEEKRQQFPVRPVPAPPETSNDPAADSIPILPSGFGDNSFGIRRYRNEELPLLERVGVVHVGARLTEEDLKALGSALRDPLPGLQLKAAHFLVNSEWWRLPQDQIDLMAHLLIEEVKRFETLGPSATTDRSLRTASGAVSFEPFGTRSVEPTLHLEASYLKLLRVSPVGTNFVLERLFNNLSPAYSSARRALWKEVKGNGETTFLKAVESVSSSPSIGPENSRRAKEFVELYHRAKSIGIPSAYRLDLEGLRVVCSHYADTFGSETKTVVFFPPKDDHNGVFLDLNAMVLQLRDLGFRVLFLECADEQGLNKASELVSQKLSKQGVQFVAASILAGHGGYTDSGPTTTISLSESTAHGLNEERTIGAGDGPDLPSFIKIHGPDSVSIAVSCGAGASELPGKSLLSELKEMCPQILDGGSFGLTTPAGIVPSEVEVRQDGRIRIYFPAETAVK